MSNSFKPTKEIISDEPPLSKVLFDYSMYWAHTHPGFQPEPLEVHINLVNDYLGLLVAGNGIDDTIDKLILSLIKENEVEESCIESVGNFLKLLFIKTIVFHDFGKVNPNFQSDEEKMNNPAFKMKAIRNYILKSHHSKLGAYLYLVCNFKDVITSGLKPNEQRLSLFFAFSLSYSIIRHHASGLKSIDTDNIKFQKDELKAMQAFLKNYQVSLLESQGVLAKEIFEEKVLNQKLFEPFCENKIKGGFPLYALIKLNFSLLTASDYLATSQYMNGQPVNDLGLIDGALREKVIHHAHYSHPYNTEAFDLADSGIPLQDPTERSPQNLNILRRNMAVNVIRTVRQHKGERLFYLEAPTGGGKTNLSMLATAELLSAIPEINKVFYVFPFTTLITQTHKAIKETLGLNDDEVSLLHSKAGFQSTGEDDCYGRQKKDYLNNLFVHYPFCLLTHIRFFDILKSNEKETNYILHRLANSIVIIDELQSYAPQHWDKILYFVQHYATAFNVRFILMSATLPRIDKLNLDLANKSAFTDLLPDAKDYFTNSNFSGRVHFRFDYRDQKLEIEELAQIVLHKSKQYAVQRQDESVFTIIEFIFKKSATEFYETMNPNFFDEIFVLSGTILEPRRREIINYLKNKNNRIKKVLLITTQVVEAGVDIDMDLGFKNISLIDSDEQLAGRVNRNVTKENCEVYLFKINEPSQLYKKDYRYSITRDSISKDEHAEILRTKDFGKLYGVVLTHINKLNGLKELQNFNSDYLPEIKKLDYKKVHDKFQLIDQNNLSVFVPLPLPKYILSADGKEEAIFSDSEIRFLSRLGVSTNEEVIEGSAVWQTYKQMIAGDEKDFVAKQIDRKLMSGILSKFTFSIFSNPKIKATLEVSFGFPASDKENDLSGFENYIYLAHHDKCYDYQKGLIETKFEDSENFIL